MPIAEIINCAFCKESIGKILKSIVCSSCNLRLHHSCANVSDKHMALLKNNPSFNFTCVSCLSHSKLNSCTRDEVGELNSFFNNVKNALDNHEAFRKTITDVLSAFKDEVSACIRQMKSDIAACTKLIDQIDSSTKSNTDSLLLENNMLYRRHNRSNIVLRGLPTGLTNLNSTVISLCSFYGVKVFDRDINYVSYMRNNKNILVKFNNVLLRDCVMNNYFKTRSLLVKNVLGGDIMNRVYLNDHFSPAASKLNHLCCKLLRQKTISKFKIINADLVKAKLIMPDGKTMICDMGECSNLFDDNLAIVT